MSTQFVRRHVEPEMVVLSVVELILTFIVVLISLTPPSSTVNFASIHTAIMCSLVACFTAFVIGLYRPQMFERARNIVVSTTLSALLSFPAIWLVSKGLGLNDYWPVAYDTWRPLKIVALWSVGALVIRLLFLIAARWDIFLHRVAVVGPVEAPSILAAVRAGRKGFLEISVVDPNNFFTTDLVNNRIRTLVISAANKDLHAIPLVKEAVKHGIRVQQETEFWERYLRRIDINNFEPSQISLLGETKVERLPLIVNRVFDVAVSLSLLVATLPITLIVALVIRIDSPGPILYRQERVGLRDRPFTLLKFRSMTKDAEVFGPRWAQQRDPRVTRVGSFIRRTRVDELPQLINILRGEMSFIGPRPERPHFVQQLDKVICHYHERSKVKPGLTGWAQVNYPYGASVDDARAKLSYDLYYVKNRTLLLDVLILLSTIRVILFQEGSR